MNRTWSPALTLLPALLVGAAAALAAALAEHVSQGLVLLDCAALGGLIGALGQLFWRLIRRRRPAWRVLGVAGLLALAGAAHLAFAPPGPAVIIVLVDCMRADRLSPTLSPNLDRLARSGWRFTEARSAAPWTRSSVPSLLSARWPVEHGLYRVRPAPDQLAPDIRLISQEFQEAGWDTAAFIQQAQLDAAFGTGRGYDRYATDDGRSPELNRHFLLWHVLHRSAPRLVYLHYLDLHGPYKPRGENKAKKPPGSQVSVSTPRGWRKTINQVREGELKLSAADRDYVAALYDGELRLFDRRMGALLDWLQADGSLDHTWLVLTADHGELLGEHEDLSHMRTPWEVLLRVPLVIRPPGGLAGGETINAPVQQVDVMPTLLEAVGLPVPAGLAGRSLLPLTRGETLPPVPSFAEEWSRPLRRASVVWEQWKLIQEGERIQLYDLAADPGETVDLAPQNPERVAALRGMLAAYFAAAAEGRSTSSIDWAAAAASGAVWTPSDAPAAGGAAPELSEETLEGLRDMGYMD